MEAKILLHERNPQSGLFWTHTLPISIMDAEETPAVLTDLSIIQCVQYINSDNLRQRKDAW